MWYTQICHGGSERTLARPLALAPANGLEMERKKEQSTGLQVATRRYGEAMRVRFSEDEIGQLKALAHAHNTNVSDVVRRLVRESAGELPVANDAVRPEIKEMVDQLRKVGVNLNQAVRAMNEGRVQYEGDLERALIAVGELVRLHRNELRAMLLKPRSERRKAK